MNSCSIKLKKDKISKIINKLDFFVFRAMEQKGLSFYKISQNPKTAESIEILNKVKNGDYTREQLQELVGRKNAQVLITAAKVSDEFKIGSEVYKIAQMVEILDTVKNSIIPFYINDYVENAKIKQDEGEKEESEGWKAFAGNLQSILTNWDQVVPNFFVFSNVFSLSTKFKFDEDGLIDLNDVADDEQKMLNKMVFDKPSNETDALDDVGKAVELFIRSIADPNRIDEFGMTSLIDYPSFMRQLFSDVENSLGMTELLTKLEKNQEKIPGYKILLEKLTPSTGLTADEFKFRLEFRNSFVKAFMPILITSIEEGTRPFPTANKTHAFKVTEAASGKVTRYENNIQTKFTTYGMPVVMPNGQEVNLAHLLDGAWVLSKEDIPKIKAYLENSSIETKVNFLKAVGFDFSPETEKMLLTTDYLTNKKQSRFYFLENHLIKALTFGKKEYTLNPYRTLVNDAGYDDQKKKIKGQQAMLSALILEELKNNPEYNIEKSVITAEGTQMHSIQLHNNFTVLNKYLSDPEAFPTLEDIMDNEPSMFWLDPRKNPSIRHSLLLNSLFYFDPSNKETFGKRRRITADGNYSLTEGEFAQITILNTGGVQLKLEGNFKKDGSSSTGLNEIDKLLQDIHGFLTTKNSNSSILRLGDKGTDLGMGMNYILDVTTGKPVKNGKPLGNIDPNMDVIRTSTFMDNVTNALLDVAEMKYLGKKGFFKTDKEKGKITHNGLSTSAKNIENTWGYFEGILTAPTKKLLNDFIESRAENEEGNINDMARALQLYSKEIEKDIQTYFDKTVESFVKKFDDLFKLGITSPELLGGNITNFPSYIRYYLANTFITDLEQMKIFFGDSIYFKDFHKRASKDSATGVFTFVDDAIIEHLNDFNNSQGLGANTNLSGRKLIERLYEQKKITKTQRDVALAKQKLSKSFKAGVIKEIFFNSEHASKIKDNIKLLQKNGFISPAMEKLYNDSLSTAINNGYKGAKEADGQGKCTFDFYRTMSILTSQWSDAQEATYQKIVEYNHYDELADEETDEAKKTEYLQKRDAVGYDPTEAVYFPPKKFQYSGPMKYSKMIDGDEYNIAPPIFDKFSLQPLIPTVIKRGSLKTTDWHLARKMEFNGISYVRVESATKVETPDVKDEIYTGYDENKPNERQVIAFNPKDGFKSEQEQFFNHLKEQVVIDAEIHDDTIFGSQIRKLILMNLSRPEFKGMKDNYVKYLGQLAELEKTSLYNDMGIVKENGKLKIKDLGKIIDYFFKEIAKKNQDSNVKKALNYDEATGKFDIPLDAAVQAQVLEGIIISAINNRVVRYKTNGSMLVQMAQTGSEAVKFDKEASAKALEAYKDDNLAYYDVQEGVNGQPTITKMEVKIALTGQWLRLLELNDVNGVKIGSLERLNEMLLNDQWVKENEKAISMISYRIPTAGRNFLDVMRVKQFMPASVGDAIVMPRECIIKSGSDFDIDKMFTFYPNIDKNGKYISFNYNESIINENLEEKKNAVVADLNYLKLARRTTIKSLNDEFKDLQRQYKGALRKDTNAREKLNKLLRRVETIIAVMDAEADSNIKSSLSKFANRNSMDDSELSKLIKSNVSYNVAEQEQWMKDNNQNIFNPMLWVDTKKQGLETLRDSIENLFNSDVEYLKLTRDQNKQYIEDLNNDLQAEINHVYDQLYAYNHIKENIQNKLYETMSEIILHPANYMELVTPSENYHILPIINDIYKKLNPGSTERKTTDYKNTQILEREKNIQKFISLLRGKSDLGIAAVANTFNIMYQLADAMANPDFFKGKTSIKTFFECDNIERSNGTITGIDFSTIFDEDGVLKSEFFAEFITAFVDVARDDYVFAANIVTELSPIMFYMKYTGMSSNKILKFANQPAIRLYTKNLSKYENMFVKLNGVLVDENNKKTSARTKALNQTLRQLGYIEPIVKDQNGNPVKLSKRAAMERFIIDHQDILGGQGLSSFYTANALENQITPDEDFSKLTKKERLVQISMLLELENLREQSNSVTEAQKFLNFDTSPFASTFDVASRNKSYEKAVAGNSIFSKETLEYIKKKSLISPLDVSSDITEILEQLFPVRNDKEFNNFLIEKTQEARNNFNNPAIISQDDEMKMARTAKNDFITFILQNFIGRSEEGMKFFHEMFDTQKDFNQYMTELVQTNKLVDMYKKIKDMTIITKDGDKETVENVFDILAQSFPMVRNIQLQRGEYNHAISTWKIADKGSNVIEKESSIVQFEDLCNLPNEEDKPIRDFFRNLALYSTFQSGLNTSENSFTSIAPINLVNKLYGFAITDFSKTSEQAKKIARDKFFSLFVNNNPSFFTLDTTETPTKEISSRGKWYSVNTPLVWKVKKEEPIPQQVIPVVKKAIVNPTGGVKVISQDDVNAYHAYLQKSNDVAPKEFFTNNTTFKVFYNPSTGKREKAPQSSKWILQENGLYNLVDKDGGEVYIEDVDLRTGIKIVTPTQPFVQTSTNPLIEAGVKPTDMYGNAAKDIQMASESTQFIGFGTIMKEGNISSTDKYAKAWGNKANTGNYTANDVIMVSGSGNFGRGGVDKTEEAKAIKNTLSEKYKPLLDKAIAAGASFRIGNQYAKGNLSDQLIAEYLQKKGYTENKMNGYSKWTAPINIEKQTSTVNTKLELAESEYRTGKIYNKEGKEIFAGIVDGKIYINKELLDKYSNEEVLKNQSKILNTILKNLGVYDILVKLPREKFIKFLIEHEKSHLEFEKEGKTFKTDDIEEAYVNARALVKIGILKLKEFDLSGNNEAVQRLEKYFPTREKYINDAVELTAKKMDNVRVSLSTITGYKVDEFKGSLWGKKLKVSSMDDFYFLQGKDGFPKNKEELREAISKDLARNFPSSLAKEYWKKILKSLPDDEKALLSNWAYYTNFKSYTTQYGKPYFDFNKEPFPELNKGDREKYTEWDSFINGVLESFAGSGKDLWVANNLISDSEGSVIDWYKNLTPEKFDKHIENLAKAMAFKSMVVASFEKGSLISATDMNARNIESLKKAYFDIKQRTEVVDTIVPKKPFERTFIPPTRDAQGNVVARNEVIDKFRGELFKPAWTSMTDAEILEKYEKEHISGETLKEFLDRISC